MFVINQTIDYNYFTLSKSAEKPMKAVCKKCAKVIPEVENH
jgi:hypothetical protein